MGLIGTDRFINLFMKTIKFLGIALLVVLLSVGYSSCSKNEEKGGSNFPSMEWYESTISHGTYQYENISDVSALYKSYTFNVNHSFTQYTKAADRTMTTKSDGSKTYTSWNITTNETRRGTWEISMNYVPELTLVYDDGSVRTINLYNLHNTPDSFDDYNGNLYTQIC